MQNDILAVSHLVLVIQKDPIRYKGDVKVKLNYSMEFVAQSYCFILYISDLETLYAGYTV